MPTGQFAENLTGLVFGIYKVIEPDYERRAEELKKTGKKRAFWKVECTKCAAISTMHSQPLKKHKGNWCSKCRKLNPPKTISLTCFNCNKIFVRQLNKTKFYLKIGDKYKCCSQKCTQEYINNKKLQTVDIGQIIELYNGGYFIIEIARMYNCSSGYISKILKNNNIILRNKDSQIYKERIKEKITRCLSLKETSIEIKMASILDNMNIKYEKQKSLKYWLFDFYLPDYKVYIECDGDYWHGNPDKYKEFSQLQKQNINRDKVKNSYCKNHEINLIRFWENDINNNTKHVVEEIKRRLNRSLQIG